MYSSILPSIATLIAFSTVVYTFSTPCFVEQYKCGYSLAAVDSYNITDFTTAVNKTATIPLLDAAHLFQVLYRCDDVQGDISGDVYCDSGCVSFNSDTEDDYCVI